MLGNQLHQFNHRGCKKLGFSSSKNIKLVIQVERGKIWLPKGMKVTNYPKVIVSQPINSLPGHLKSHLEKRMQQDAAMTRTSSQMLNEGVYRMNSMANDATSLFCSGDVGGSVRVSEVAKGPKSMTGSLLLNHKILHVFQLHGSSSNMLTHQSVIDAWCL